MKWRGRRGSSNIEDRRRRGGGAARAGGIGGIGLVALLLIGMFTGVDVTQLLSGDGLGGTQTVESTGELTEADQQAGQFVSVVLADTEAIWSRIFQDQLNARYVPPTLVLFKGATQSPCGNASGASGPFYCPADKKAYLDTDFFTMMSRKMGAGGDFAAAYVVAHEVSHHVQNELGTLGKANQLRRQVSQTDSNRISVMIELQADCYSGIWARYAAETLGTVEDGDIEEAVNAAKQIGDDTLQRNAGRRPMPHTFTHGTSEQRMRWFAIGYKTADLNNCDTFAAREL